MKTFLRLSLLVALTGSLLASCTPTDDDTILPTPTPSDNVHIVRPGRQQPEISPIINPALSQTTAAPVAPVAKPVARPASTAY